MPNTLSPLESGDLEVSSSGYHATWNPTEQIPERHRTDVCESEFCTLDPTRAVRRCATYSRQDCW